jgi:IS605 OrfB family transposase
MVRTLTISLRPTDEQAKALLHTMEALNAACNFVSQVAWETREFNTYRLRAKVYGEVRTRFGLPAQLAQHAVQRVTDAYKASKARRAGFRPLGAVTYDPRVMRVIGVANVSMTLRTGREKIALSTGDYHANRLRDAALGEADLVYLPEKNRFRLHLSLKIPDPPKGEANGFLGVDLGVVNLATDSDGTAYSGAQVNGLRRRHRRLRARTARKFTRSARRLHRKRRRKERRFATHTNHVLAKRIVATAKGTGRGIALEKLTGIRSRITARRAQRATLSSWSFSQLRCFIEYKAQAAGVPVILVDPRNTSRTCPACGHVDKANRRSQSEFVCTSCGCAGGADYFAAVIIGRRAAVSQPHASAVGLASSTPVGPGLNAHTL